jgi:predicted Zn-dependent peptidase
LVGDFNSDVALRLVKKYFESIPSQPPPPAVDTTEPEQKGERRKSMEDAFAQAPRIDIVYKVPPGNAPDSYALKIVGEVLSGGLSARLHQKLVKEREMALSVSAGPDERRGPSLFWISIMARPNVNLTELEGLVYKELDRIKVEPIADWELDKIRMQVRRRQAQGLYSTRTRANTLGQYAVYYNDPALINSMQAKLSQVTKADVQRVAATYLKETNRTVVTTLPKAKPASDQS